MTHLRLKASTAVLAIMLAATPTQAQTPTIDMSVLAKATETVTNTLKQVQSLTSIEGVVGKLADAAGVGTQLGQLKGMLQIMGNAKDAIGALTQMGQLRGILNVIGEINQTANALKSLMNIGNMFKSGGSMPSFQGIQSGLGAVNQFANMANNNTFTRSFQGLQSTMTSPPNNLGALQGRLQQHLYHSGSGSAADVEAINAVRSANTRAAATGGMAVAVQGKDYLQKSEKELEKLTEGMKQTKDVRGDIQANTAAILKLIEVVQVGNAQLAAQTHLHSAQTIAADNYNTGGGSSGGNN
jgi:hypothetical protein